MNFKCLNDLWENGNNIGRSDLRIYVNWVILITEFLEIYCAY